MRVRAGLLAVSFCVMGVVARPADARLVGRILQIGFPASGGVDFGGGGEIYRHGKWLPVAVELRLEGQPQFTGFVRIEQDDKDGDRNFCEVPVTLVAEGGVARTFWLYAMANPRQRGAARAFSVQVVDEEGNGVPLWTPSGESVDRLTAQQPLVEVDTESTIVLDISEMPLNRLDRAMQASGRALEHPLIVARTTSRLVPDLWHGLEMVDYIFWDDPNPEALDRSQMLSLIQWIQHGGTLVVGVGRTSEAVSRSALGAYLPVDITGQRLTDELPDLRYYFYLKEPDDPAHYESAINVCRAKAKPGAVVELHEKRIDSDLIVHGEVGAGRVIFVGGSLRDVWNVPSDRLAPLAKLLMLRYGTEDEEKKQQPRFGYTTTKHLFIGLHDFINFHQSGRLYLMVAIGFVIVYILVSTLGSWQWLRRRSRLHHAWTAFTICAIAASGVSIASVQWAQGFGHELHQLTIVTGRADAVEASAYVQFGYKTSNFTNVDLWLPSGGQDEEGPLLSGCHLRPLPPDPEFAGQTFVAPQSYRLRPGLGMIENLPVRATLKQLEGQWLGQIPGMVTGRIVMNRTNWRKAIDNSSYIENHLGVDLEDPCYLIQAQYNVGELGESGAGSRDRSILVHALPEIKAGQRLNKLAELLYQKPGETSEYTLTEMNGRNLRNRQKAWSQSYAGVSVWGARSNEERQALTLEDHDKILMLLSTCEEFDRKVEGNQRGWGVELVRTYVRHLDLSDGLGPDMMLFVGFSDGPPPFHLRGRTHSDSRQNDWEVIKPEKTRTMYRIWIPVQHREQP